MNCLLAGMITGALLYLLFCTNPGRVVLAIMILALLLLLVI